MWLFLYLKYCQDFSEAKVKKQKNVGNSRLFFLKIILLENENIEFIALLNRTSFRGVFVQFSQKSYKKYRNISINTKNIEQIQIIYLLTHTRRLIITFIVQDIHKNLKIVLNLFNFWKI